MEKLNVTTLTIMIQKNTFGDDSDVQVDDEELVCPEIDTPNIQGTNKMRL